MVCRRGCEYECDPSVPQGEGLISLLEMFHVLLRSSRIAKNLSHKKSYQPIMPNIYKNLCVRVLSCIVREHQK